MVDNEVYVLSDSPELSVNLRRIYFDSSDSPFSALITAVKNSSSKETAACVLVNGVVYSAAKGGAKVGITRNQMAATILQSENDNVISASGYPKEGDKITLSLANSDNKTLEIDFSKEELVSEPDFTTSPKLPEKIQSMIGNFFKKLPQRTIYLKTEAAEEVSPQSKRLTFTVAAILLILLAVSIGFGIRQKHINDVKNKYQGILGQAQDEVDQAISLASVDSTRSRELFSDSEQKLTQIESMNVKDSKIDALKKKLDDSRAAVLGEYEVTPQMFLDLTLLSSGFKGDAISFSGGTIYILDKSGERIVSVDISTKKSLVVAGPSAINSAQGMAAYENKTFVLENDGIYEVDSGAHKVIDKTWPGDALIAAFAGNMYILDKSGNQIFRYQGQNNAFSDKENWLAAGTNANFANVGQISIDGSIYALYPNSKILKFSQGSPQNFNVKGAVPEIGNIDALYANPDNQYIYLLDKAGGRVVITDKKGVYKAQYVDAQISGAINLVVSEADKKIILITGDKLYLIDLQNQ